MPLREILVTFSVALAAVAVIITLVYSVRRRQTRLDRALAEQATIQAQLEEAYRIARVVDWRWVPSTGTVTLSSSARDVFGTTWTSADAGVRLVHPDDREHVEATIREALRRDGSYACTSRLIRPDSGQVRWFEHRGRIHRDADGTVTQVNGVSIDVTERQQAVEAAAVAERVAHESLAELEAVLESVPAVVWVARDPECRTVTGSRAAYESLRVPLGRNLSKTAPAPERPTNFRVCHADGREYAPEELPLQRAAATGEPQRGVRTDILFDDGTRQVLYGNAHPLKDAAGRVTGAVAGFVDITPLIDSETALAQSEALSRALGEAAPDFVWVTDRSGNPLCVNPRWSEYTGLSLEDLRTRGWQSVIHPDDHATLSGRWAQAARDGTGFEAEFRYRRLDGEYRWFWGRAVPLRDATGQIEKWVGTSTDIHERKMAEDILRETERQYRETAGELETIIELAPIGLVVARDSTCAVVSSNPYAARLFGVPPGTNVSASAAPAERLPYVIRRRDAIVPPDDMPLQKAMRTGEPQLDDVLELVRPDGSRADVIVSSVPLKDDAGRVRGAIGTIQDVTAFNAIQKQLSDSEERLRLAVEGADLGMWETDLRTGLTHNNARNLAIFGFEPESGPVAGARWLGGIL